MDQKEVEMMARINQRISASYGSSQHDAAGVGGDYSVSEVKIPCGGTVHVYTVVKSGDVFPEPDIMEVTWTY